MIEIYLALIFIIAAAIVAVQAKELLSSVISLGAAGVGLSLAFLLLKAPDLAITQLVVEILSLIVLVRATIKKDLPFPSSGRWLFNTAATVLFIALFLCTGYLALKGLPGFGDTLPSVSHLYLEGARQMTGMSNIAASIMLDFRIFDTLAEIAIVFVAVIGVLAMSQKMLNKR